MKQFAEFRQAPAWAQRWKYRPIACRRRYGLSGCGLWLSQYDSVASVSIIIGQFPRDLSPDLRDGLKALRARTVGIPAPISLLFFGPFAPTSQLFAKPSSRDVIAQSMVLLSKECVFGNPSLLTEGDPFDDLREPIEVPASAGCLGQSSMA